MTEIAPISTVSHPQPSQEPAASAALLAPRTAPAAFTRHTGAPGTAGGGAAGADLGERFEAAVLTPLMASILPPEDSPVWGGSAGKLWRGLFAEEIAAATARSGGIGIAGLVNAAVASRISTEGDEG